MASNDRSIFATLSRHGSALAFVLRSILPIIFQTGRRPVLFSRWSGMGDIICTVPAALELKKRHPGATFIYNCNPDFTAVPKLARVADRCTHFQHIGLVGYWYAFLFAGFYHFAHGDDRPGEISKDCMVAEFCEQFGIPVQQEHPRIEIGSEALERARGLVRQSGLEPEELIIIHPGRSWPVKEWPMENWRELVSSLRRQGYTDIAQVGVGRYANFGDVDLAVVPGVVSWVDKLSLEDTFAVIALAKLHIGIDSGPLHIAVAVGTPAVGIFGMTLPNRCFSERISESFVRSSVECRGCYHRLPRVDWVTSCPNDIRCMKTLSVDEVLGACLKALKAVPHSLQLS